MQGCPCNNSYTPADQECILGSTADMRLVRRGNSHSLHRGYQCHRVCNMSHSALAVSTCAETRKITSKSCIAKG
jgi:hypothetical protein